MAYSGRHKRNVVVSSVQPARINWGTGVDPRHSDSAMGTDQGFPSLKEPTVESVPEFAIDSYDPAAINAAYMPSHDYEPDGHEGTGTPPRTSNRYDEIRSDTARHDEARGATQKNMQPKVMRSVTQTFGSPLLESLPPAADDNSASATGEGRRALRGRNSLGLNNPGSPTVNFSGDYIRQGREQFRITDRRMGRRRMTHTQRAQYLNLADTAHVTRSPEGVNYSPYGSPYDSVARMRSGPERSMMRRDPRKWDEDTVTDGSEQTFAADHSQYLTWGM